MGARPNYINQIFLEEGRDMSTNIERFSYKGMPRLIVPVEGGFIINYQCIECGEMFCTPAFPPGIFGLLENRPLNYDLECIIKSMLSPEEYRTIFDTGVCRKCEAKKKFGGNKIKENEDD